MSYDTGLLSMLKTFVQMDISVENRKIVMVLHTITKFWCMASNMHQNHCIRQKNGSKYEDITVH